jgi:hypothetical protein
MRILHLRANCAAVGLKGERYDTLVVWYVFLVDPVSVTSCPSTSTMSLEPVQTVAAAFVQRILLPKSITVYFDPLSPPRFDLSASTLHRHSRHIYFSIT